jgi:tetratricopeptide (TPR) repeat protein
LESEFDRLRAELEPLRCGDPRALEISRHLVQLDPSSADAWEALAWDLEFTLFPNPGETTPEVASDSRFAELIHAWDTLAALDESAVWAVYNCGTAYRKVGAFDQAARKHLEAGRRELSLADCDAAEAASNFSIAADCAAEVGDLETLLVALDLWQETISPEDDDYADEMEEIAGYREFLDCGPSAGS